MSTEEKATEIAKRRYNRIAPLYDLNEDKDEFLAKVVEEVKTQDGVETM